MLWIIVIITSTSRFYQISTTYVSCSIVLLHISNFLPHLKLRNRSIQIVVISNFVIILNVCIKRFDCITINEQCKIVDYVYCLHVTPLWMTQVK